MINAYSLSLSFGEQIIFKNLSFTLDQDQKIGVVGNNGAGKSTLLRVLAGQQELDGGTFSCAKNKTIGYLPQEVILISDRSIIDETMTVFQELEQIQQRIVALEPAAESGDLDALEEYAELYARLADYNPERARAQAEKVLMGLGFKPDQMGNSVSTLSVGWRMRVVLAKLLLQEADFYLFDEPTNHLDIMAQEWFVNFLKQAEFGFMIVSHERYLLNQVCNEIFELELGNGTFYRGNYDKYRAQKKHDLALLEEAYKQQQKEILRKKQTIDRFRASASKAKMAQSMMKELDKIEKIELPPSIKNISVHLPEPQRAGKEVLTVHDVSYGFGNKQIFQHVSFVINRAEKVALVAANGVGKTTLFNVIAGRYQPQSGSVTFGHNVTYALFDQDQSKVLDHEATVLDNITRSVANKTEQQIRTLLGTFLFSSDDVHKKVKVLSGGEKNRVSMVKVLLQDANLLLLDEPTNHLDMPSKDVLLKALKEYKGTILFVSHDHYFLNELANRILELTPNGVNGYLGNFEEYLYQKNLYQPNVVEAARSEHKAEVKKPSLAIDEQNALRKESRALEQKIQKLEKHVDTLEHSFASLTYGSPEFDTAQQKLTNYRQELDSLMREWEALERKLS